MKQYSQNIPYYMQIFHMLKDLCFKSQGLRVLIAIEREEAGVSSEKRAERFLTPTEEDGAAYLHIVTD